MLRWFVENVGSLLLALLLAVVVWTAAVTAQNPEEVRVFQQAIPIELIGQPPDTVLVGEVPATAEVTLRAPRSVWATLTANQIRVTADLATLPTGESDVPLVATVNERAARVTVVSPDHIRLNLEPLLTLELPITLETSGVPAPGYQAGEPSLTPESVEISGPASNVNQVVAITTQLSLEDARVSVESTLTLTPVDEAGRPVAGVTLAPDQTKVAVNVRQLGGYRDVAVKINITGQVASGYRMSNISVSPPVVTLFSADPTLVEQLPGFLETQTVDLTGLTDDLDSRVSLNLPEGVTLVGAQTVVVQVSVAAIIGSLTVQRELEITGLSQQLFAELSPPTVDVILSGPLPVLDALRPEDVRVLLNLIGLNIGTHQVEPLVVVLPASLTAEAVLPATIEVTISLAGPGTPGPTPTATATPKATARPR